MRARAWWRAAARRAVTVKTAKGRVLLRVVLWVALMLRVMMIMVMVIEWGKRMVRGTALMRIMRTNHGTATSASYKPQKRG